MTGTPDPPSPTSTHENSLGAAGSAQTGSAQSDASRTGLWLRGAAVLAIIVIAWFGIRAALGSAEGIRRYGQCLLPMAEAKVETAVDVSNRPYLIWKVEIPKPKLGEMDTELFKEWFQAFAQNAGLTLHVENLYGENSHHIVESCYKGLARALRLDHLRLTCALNEGHEGDLVAGA